MTEDLKTFLDKRIKARGYSSTSKNMRDLVRGYEERASEKRLKALIEEGLSSPLDPTAWEDQRSALRSKTTLFKR